MASRSAERRPVAGPEQEALPPACTFPVVRAAAYWRADRSAAAISTRIVLLEIPESEQGERQAERGGGSMYTVVTRLARAL